MAAAAARIVIRANPPRARETAPRERLPRRLTIDLLTQGHYGPTLSRWQAQPGLSRAGRVPTPATLRRLPQRASTSSRTAARPRPRVEAVKRLQKQHERRLRHVWFPAHANRTQERANRILFTPRTCLPGSGAANVVSGRPKRSLTCWTRPRACQLACSELRSAIGCGPAETRATASRR